MGGIAKFSGGLRNFRGGVEKFSAERVESGGVNFFGRGDIFSGGVGNILGAGLRFFGCGWELLRRPS